MLEFTIVSTPYENTTSVFGNGKALLITQMQKIASFQIDAKSLSAIETRQKLIKALQAEATAATTAGRTMLRFHLQWKGKKPRGWTAFQKDNEIFN